MMRDPVDTLKDTLIRIRDLSRSGRGRGLTGTPTHTWVNRSCGDSLQIQTLLDSPTNPFLWDGEPCSMCAAGVVILHETLSGKHPTEWDVILEDIQDRIERGDPGDPWSLFHPWRNRRRCVLGGVECLREGVA